MDSEHFLFAVGVHRFAHAEELCTDPLADRLVALREYEQTYVDNLLLVLLVQLVEDIQEYRKPVGCIPACHQIFEDPLPGLAFDRIVSVEKSLEDVLVVIPPVLRKQLELLTDQYVGETDDHLVVLLGSLVRPNQLVEGGIRDIVRQQLYEELQLLVVDDARQNVNSSFFDDLIDQPRQVRGIHVEVFGYVVQDGDELLQRGRLVTDLGKRSLRESLYLREIRWNLLHAVRVKEVRAIAVGSQAQLRVELVYLLLGLTQTKTLGDPGRAELQGVMERTRRPRVTHALSRILVANRRMVEQTPLVGDSVVTESRLLPLLAKRARGSLRGLRDADFSGREFLVPLHLLPNAV